MFPFSFNRIDTDPIQVPLEAGGIVFVVGPNGCGKSSLMHRLYTQNRNNCRRILAHRKTWFKSNRIELTSAAKKQNEQNILNQDSNITSRWQDPYAEQRSNVSIYDLIDSQNVRARKIADAVDNDDIESAQALSAKDAPLKIINELLFTANIPVVISVEKDDEIFASKNGSPLYSIAELSDGERNALLIATDILTAKEGSLIIVDEPERHLHRSIVSPLLTSLFQKRPDCAFVVSTHDVFLPVDNPDASVLMIRRCVWTGAQPTAWEADILDSSEDVPQDIKKLILGSKRNILFVEGDDESLDRQIYQILYPDITVLPKGNCVGVERAVHGIKGTNGLHWVEAIGLIDADDRTQEQITGLRELNIFALPCYSVESLYYHQTIIRKIAEKVSETTGEIASELSDSALSTIISSIQGHKERLCARLSEKRVRSQVMANLPTHQDLLSGGPLNINIDIQQFLQREHELFDSMISNSDIDNLIDRYPVRETPVLNNIARALGFQDRYKYEGSVRTLLANSEASRETLRSILGELTLKIDELSQ